MTENVLPTFQTERLVLRAVTTNDIPNYEKYFVDYEVIEQLAAHVPWPYPKDGVACFLNNSIFPKQGKTSWLWGIFEKANPDELIGCVHLWREGKPQHRGFWLGKKFWGQGYMTEAVHPVMDYAFNHLGFDKLIFANAVGNLKSRRVKEKTGAKLIDVTPAKFVNPKYTEHEIFELKKEDWKKPDEKYFLFSSDKNLLKIDQIYALLVNAYWYKGISKETLQKPIEGSLCFGAYAGSNQVAFARVVTDGATFAWLCDVIVDDSYKGQGLAKELMRFIQADPRLQNLRRFCLATKDAHGLYAQFAFKVTETPQNWMEIKNNDVYLNQR